MKFIATLITEADDRITVLFPDLSGCGTCGKDLDDALRMGAEALSGHIGAMRDLGIDIPTPSTAAAIRKTMEYPDATLALIPVIEDYGSNARVNVTFDQGLLAAIDAEAKARGVTRSGFLATAARKELIGA